MATRRRISSGIEMRNLKRGYRLIGLFMFMALIVAITGGFGAWSMKRVGDRIQGMLTGLANQQKLVMLMELSQKDCHISLLQAAMVGSEMDKVEDAAEDYQAKSDLFKNQCETILNGNPKLGIKPAVPGSTIETKAKAALAGWAKFEAVAEHLLGVKRNLLKGGKLG